CFFFQAEDGIRDFHVTGVQTCALPIYRTRTPSIKARGYAEVKFIDIHGLAGGLSLGATQAGWTMTHRAGLDFGSPALEANRDHFPYDFTTAYDNNNDETKWQLDGMKTDAVFGVPPCSGFSSLSSKNFRGMDSPAN